MEHKRTKHLAVVLFALSILTLCGIIFVVLQLFTSKEFSYEFCCCAIGMISTALVTYFLLQGQSSSVEQINKNTKIFEKKMEVFSAFSQKLNDIVREGRISDKEAIDLQFQVSYLDTHINSPERIKEISEHVKKIVEGIENKWKQHDLLSELFAINKAIRAELYPMLEQEDKKDCREQAVNNFRYLAIPSDKEAAYMQCNKIIHALHALDNADRENILKKFRMSIENYCSIIFDIRKDILIYGGHKWNAVFAEVKFSDDAKKVNIRVWHKDPAKRGILNYPAFQSGKLKLEEKNGLYWFDCSRLNTDEDIVKFVYNDVLPTLLEYRKTLTW